MKRLKEFFVIVLAICVSFSFCAVTTNASEDETLLIGYCTNNDLYDQYAIDNADLLASSLNLQNSKVIVGRPLTIYSDDSEQIQLYPFIVGDTIVATLEVYDVDGVVGGCFSQNYVDFLNDAKRLTSIKNPLFLYRNITGIYGEIGGMTYNVDLSGELARSIAVQRNKRSIEVNNCFAGSEINITRSGVIYCVWTDYFLATSFQDLAGYCVVESLFNILKNYGCNEFNSYVDLKNDIKYYYPYILTISISKANTEAYLSARNISYVDSGSCSNTSYMYMTDVQTMVQTNHKYGLAFNRNVNNPADGGHTTAIVGYAGSTSSSYYIFFDPHRAGSGNYTTGTFYLDSSLRQFTSQGVTYKWQDGYISNIDISNMN